MIKNYNTIHAVYTINTTNRIALNLLIILWVPHPKKCLFDVLSHRERTIALVESLGVNTNPSNDVFFSHRFSLLPLFNRATMISKAIRNPVTFCSWTDMLLFKLSLSGAYVYLGVCICVSVSFLIEWGVSKKKHGTNSLAESLRDHLTHSILHPAHHSA